MGPEVISVATGLLSVAIASWLSYVLAGKQSRKQEARARHVMAATDLAQPLRDLRTLVRSHGRVPVEGQEVASAFRAWFEAYDRHGHRLPSGWGHIERSVRAAAGTVFGAISFVDIRPDTSMEPLEPPDFLWQDFADDYIGYVLDRLMRWGDSDSSTPADLLQFDPWLTRTGRREPFGRNRRAS